MPLRTATFLLTVLVAAAYAALVLAPLESLLALVPDDAFYYLQTARNLADGAGPTLDGVHPHSGYHPLWLWILVPVAKVFTDPVSLLRAALALTGLLHVLGALAVGRVLAPMAGPTRSGAVTLAWLASPLMLLLATQAVESTLYVVTLAGALWGAQRFLERGTDRDAMALGLLLGVAFLARTEAGVLAAVGCVVLPALRGQTVLSRANLRSTLIIGLWFSAVAGLWFAYCHATTGSIFQSSGTMKALWGEAALAERGFMGRGLRMLRIVWAAYVGVPWLVADQPAVSWWNGIWFGLVAGTTYGIVLRWRAGERVRPGLSLWLVGSTLLLGAIYGWRAVDFQVWYRALPAFSWVVAAALCWPPMPRVGRAVGTSLVSVSVLGGGVFLVAPPRPYPWQVDVWASTPGFEELVPKGEAIGAFNAGIPSYFGTRTWVNLDGLANAAVVPYYQREEVEVFLAAAGIHWIADEERALKRAMGFMKKPPSLVAKGRADLAGWPWGSRFLWKL